MESGKIRRIRTTRMICMRTDCWIWGSGWSLGGETAHESSEVVSAFEVPYVYDI
jgi:hypothetical protein